MIWSGGVSVSGRNVAVCGGGGSRAGMETEEVKMRSFLWCDQMIDVADHVNRARGFLRCRWLWSVC